MSGKTFTLLILGVLVLGVGFGGAFVAGLVVGKGQETAAAAAVVPSLPASAARPSAALGTGDADLSNLRGWVQSGELSREELTTLRERFQSQLGGAGGFTGPGGGFGGGPALTGTITGVEGSLLTLNTAQGPLQVSVGGDVTIRQTTDATIEDLTDGARVTVIGQRGDDGIVAATTIQLIPEGGDFIPGGFGRGGGFGGGDLRGGGAGGGN